MSQFLDLEESETFDEVILKNAEHFMDTADNPYGDLIDSNREYPQN